MRNKIKGRNKRPKSNLATGRDYAYDKKYQASPERKKYRVELNREARKKKVYGKRWKMGKDLSHKKDGTMFLESRKKNRARNRDKK